MPRDAMIEFYGGVFAHVWEGSHVPTPQALADWIESQTWHVDPEWLSQMIQRLRAWPADRNYPLIPDDEALEARVKEGPSEEERWWEPGAIRGDLVRHVRTPRL